MLETKCMTQYDVVNKLILVYFYMNLICPTYTRQVFTMQKMKLVNQIQILLYVHFTFRKTWHHLFTHKLWIILHNGLNFLVLVDNQSRRKTTMILKQNIMNCSLSPEVLTIYSHWTRERERLFICTKLLHDNLNHAQVITSDEAIVIFD